jgi:hypothetical protein
MAWLLLVGWYRMSGRRGLRRIVVDAPSSYCTVCGGTAIVSLLPIPGSGIVPGKSVNSFYRCKLFSLYFQKFSIRLRFAPLVADDPPD